MCWFVRLGGREREGKGKGDEYIIIDVYTHYKMEVQSCIYILHIDNGQVILTDIFVRDPLDES